MQQTPTMTANFYSEGFFGYGEIGDYKDFTPAHIIPVLVIVAIIFLIYFKRDDIRKSKHENTYCLILGVLCLLAEFSFYWRACYVGPERAERSTMLALLPFQVCDLSAIVTGVMMLNKNKGCFKYSAFVCPTLGVIPLYSPTVIDIAGPSYFRYYQFWLHHGVPIISVFYMLFVHNFKLHKKDIIVPYASLFTLGVFAMMANNAIPEATFMYLQGSRSLSAYFPNNQLLRLLIVAVIALPFFLLVQHLFSKFNEKESKRLKN